MIGVGLYRARRTPLHLLPAWAKVALLAGTGIALMTFPGLYWSVSAALVSAALFASTLPPLGASLKAGLMLVLISILASAWHLIWGDPLRGIEVACTLFALLLLSLAVTASTAMEAMLSLFTTLARPLRRWIPPEAIGLSASLMIRSVPEAARIAGEARDAARARGVSRRPGAIIVPTGVRSVGYALRVGDALTARGLAERDTRTSDAR